MLHSPSVPATPFHGCYLVALYDLDGRDIFSHGLVAAPEGWTEAQAVKAVDDAYDSATAACPDEWNYDDVFDYLRARGFQDVVPATWVEPN